MPLILQDTELNELMQDFYILTGIRIILFDENKTEIACYPPFAETFCADLRKNEDFNKKCVECDRQSFERCKKTKALDIYKCHAGLIDATMPIFDGERILGYMMFGQITDNRDKDEFFEQMTALCKRCGAEGLLDEKIKKIKYRNNRQILAAAKILETCAHYVRMKEIIKPSGRQLIDYIDRFIDEHIAEEISVVRLCDELNIGRTQLYELTRPTVGGIASYIKRRRLEKAKMLIKSGKMSVTEVSEAVGFIDYNYFLRVFKQEYGISPKKYAKKHTNNK